MRVIWISTGLLVAFIVVLVAFYEPEPELHQEASAEASLPVDPFVEEKSDQSGNVDNNVANNDIELAVLPTKPDTQLQDDVAADQIQQVKNQPEKANKDQPGNEVASTNIVDANVTAENVESLVVAKVQEPVKETKKLGPAMVVFEREKNRDKVAVIVHESNTQKLTEKEIKALYLDRLTRWQDGSRVVLFDLPLGDKYRDKFSKSILKMTALEADLQETKRRQLRIKANDVEVKAKNVIVSYVEQNPNAVAYVPLNLVREKSNVKVILTIP